MPRRKGRVGILTGGGPAPGINSAISSATIEAINSGLEVTGLYDGFESLISGHAELARPLSIADVARIHAQGGSILRTSRANPTRSPEDLRSAVDTMKKLGLSYMVTIGGEDTAFAASEVARASGGAVRIAHVPKTIDNDLPLPGGMPTFGFESARHFGTEQVLNLMEESRTSNRWVFVVVMGRKAGHLALGIGKAAGATITVIPEEFPDEHVSLERLCAVLSGSILKRRVMGRTHGVAVIAEGIVEKLHPDELKRIPGAETEYDPHGHIRLEEIPIATILRRAVQARFTTLNDPITVTDVTLGYALRCAPPIPFDIDYTRTLGYGAVRFLLSEPQDEALKAGGMVFLEQGHLWTLPFSEMRDNAGRPIIRVVDITSEHFRVAREYMIRLEPKDLQDPKMLKRLAEAGKVTPEEMLKSFSPHIESV